MDVDRPSLVSYSVDSEDGNAEAGPSTPLDIPVIFPPPTGPPTRLPLFNSTQDLITCFQLLPAYDKYVHQHIRSSADGQSQSNSTPGDVVTPVLLQATMPSGLDKGKGKEVFVQTPAGGTPGGGDGIDGDGDDDDGKGDKKRKNYKHLIKGIPGKHSMKKDDYLQMMMQVPPKQKVSMTKFDSRTQREAFSVSLEGLKGWNINALVAESAQAREDRKKRKELKKLAKIQAGVIPAGSQPASTISPVSAASTGTAGPSVQRGQTPSSAGTPRPVPVLPQRSGSRPPGPKSGLPVDARPRTPALNMSSSASTPRPTPAPPLLTSLASTDPMKRGRKREHEEDASNANAVLNNASAAAQKRPMATGAVRAGIEGARPRPVKKPRMDSNTHTPIGMPVMAREVPQQQPTPQGV